MRKPAAVLAATLLLVSVVASPPATAQPVVDAPPTCDTECVIAQVRSLLGPLQPIVDLAGPVLGELGASLTTLNAALAGAPQLDVADAAGALLDEIHELGGDVLALLQGAGIDVGALDAALTQLHDLAEAQVAPGGASSPGPATPGAPGAPATSASASGPTGFGGVLSTAGASSPDASSPAIPDVPVGGVLELGPLALPTFDAVPAASATELAAGAAVADLVRPAAAAAAAIPEVPDGTRARAVVRAVCVQLRAAGLVLDQLRTARLPIRI